MRLVEMEKKMPEYKFSIFSWWYFLISNPDNDEDDITYKSCSSYFYETCTLQLYFSSFTDSNNNNWSYSETWHEKDIYFFN